MATNKQNFLDHRAAVKAENRRKSADAQARIAAEAEAKASKASK